MSYTLLNYPAAFASEGNPLANNGFPGEYDPYVHGSHDIIDIDDEKGYFSFDVSLASMASSKRKLLAWISSIWHALASWPSHLQSSRLDGTMLGDKSLLAGFGRKYWLPIFAKVAGPRDCETGLSSGLMNSISRCHLSSGKYSTMHMNRCQI